MSTCCSPTQSDAKKNTIWEAVSLLLLVCIGAFVMRKAGIGGLETPMGQVAGLGGVFIIGILASISSCLAVVGGLLLSIGATYAEATQGQSHSKRLLPLMQFNIGRIAGYLLFGGLVGMLGNAITLSTRGTGFVTIVIAFVMISMGLNLLRILPKNVCTIPLPASMVKAMRRLTTSRSPVMPFVLGALTFFVPCGFTQSMQLLALASHSFVSGALIMGMFSLGTLPALLGISIASSFAEGHAGKLFIRFSGAVVIVLGIMNIQSGIVLTGFDIDSLKPTMHASAQTDPNVTINNKGQQIVSLLIENSGYVPAQVTIDPGRETWIYATAKVPPAGCATMLTAPAFNISTPISVGGNWLGPIKDPTKDFVVACSMGMLKTAVHVRPS